MIFYFSATGNCKYVASRIAEKTGDTIISVGKAYKEKHYQITLKEDEMLGFVVPTYFGVLPKLVSDFLEEADINATESNFVYLVDTYGFHYGNLSPELEKILVKKIGRPQDADYLLQMVDNWVPQFDLTDLKYVKDAESKAETGISRIIQKISERTAERVKGEWPAPVIMMMRAAYKSGSRTKNFSVSDKCIGCGLCERQCPMEAIKLKGKKPAWEKKNCTVCLGCLHRCPVNAISYTKNTVGHGQYFNPNTEPDVK